MRRGGVGLGVRDDEQAGVGLRVGRCDPDEVGLKPREIFVPPRAATFVKKHWSIDMSVAVKNFAFVSSLLRLGITPASNRPVWRSVEPLSLGDGEIMASMPAPCLSPSQSCTRGQSMPLMMTCRAELVGTTR